MPLPPELLVGIETLDDALPGEFGDIDRALLTDPQTSGGQLVSCKAAAVDQVLALFRRHGFEQAAEIGEVQAQRKLSQKKLVLR